MSNEEKSNVENVTEKQPIRQSMVNTAIHFLINPDVKDKPYSSKVGFLKKKGLTDSEILAAFEHVGHDSKLTSSPAVYNPNPGNALNPLPPPVAYSFWSNISRFSSSLIVVAVALYGLHRFYKLYIEPWLFGKEEDELTVLKSQLIELNKSVLQLKNAVTSLEKNIVDQHEQVERTFLTESSVYLPIPMAIADLKTEISSVKSILINRHQFPAPPKVASPPSIPLWQLPASETVDDVSEQQSATAVVLDDAPKSPSKADSSVSEQMSTTGVARNDSQTSPSKVGNGASEEQLSTTGVALNDVQKLESVHEAEFSDDVFESVSEYNTSLNLEESLRSPKTIGCETKETVNDVEKSCKVTNAVENGMNGLHSKDN